MQLRAATRADLVAIQALEREVFANEIYPAFFFRQAHDLWPEWLLVAVEHSVVQGYALAAPANEERVAWLLSMAVSGKSRGRGLGMDLLRSMITTLREAGILQLRLTVHPDNPARRLYEQAGFQVLTVEEEYFEDGPRVLMRALL